MRDEILILNESELSGKHISIHEPYEYIKYEVIPRNAFSRCYVSVYEIPPGKANYPYHYHIANTEVFYIINGQGIVRTPKGDRVIKAGDFVVCPPTENGAHKIINRSENETLKYIDFGTANSPDIVKYPDSDKTGILVHNQPNIFFKNDDKANYYDGE
jgi:uncharacterized cupin superfamily protein